MASLGGHPGCSEAFWLDSRNRMPLTNSRSKLWGVQLINRVARESAFAHRLIERLHRSKAGELIGGFEAARTANGWLQGVAWRQWEGILMRRAHVRAALGGSKTTTRDYRLSVRVTTASAGRSLQAAGFLFAGKGGVKCSFASSRLLRSMTGNEPERIEIKTEGKVEYVVDAAMLEALTRGYQELHKKE
jgi:hypothetical protein